MNYARKNEIAKHCGVTITTFYNWLKDPKKITIGMIEKMNEIGVVYDKGKLIDNK